MDKLSKFA